MDGQHRDHLTTSLEYTQAAVPEPSRTNAPSIIEIARTYTFDAAHQLQWHPGKCARLHGHTYQVEVVVRGEVDANGVLLDFDHLDVVVKGAILDTLDHVNLNDVLDNPTVERVTVYIWRRLSTMLLPVSEITLWETPRSWARLRA